MNFCFLFLILFLNSLHFTYLFLLVSVGLELSLCFIKRKIFVEEPKDQYAKFRVALRLISIIYYIKDNRSDFKSLSLYSKTLYKA